jgi:hypothetical protein
MASIGNMTCMAKRKRATLFDQTRQAVLDSDDTRYRICQQTGIDQSALSRFVHGERGLSEDAMNRLAEYLHLEIVTRQHKGR